jgi:protein TonB
MFLDKYKYSFLGRMVKPEGLPPAVLRTDRLRLGTSRTIVFEAALSFSLLVVIAGFRFFPALPKSKPAVTMSRETVSVEDIEITRQIDRPPPPPRPPVPIEAPSDEVLADVDFASTEIDLAATVAPSPPRQEEEDEEEYFVAVEEMPQLIGGVKGLMRNLVYPELAIRAGIQGRVYVLAYINERGEVDRAEVVRGIGGGCDEAALQAVKKSKFTPGKQRGRPIKVRMSIPVDFRLTT